MVMEMMRSSSSDLNPNAPIFIPLAYRAVEDFSEQWWELVKSSPCFRDYWIREVYYQQQQEEEEMNEEDLVEALFCQQQKEEEEEEAAIERGKKEVEKEMVKWGKREWRELRGLTAEIPKYEPKAPKIVNLKSATPRLIQQPR